MIKTHKPRGHIWTNSSAFQQTQEFRNIQFEECLPSRAKILAQGQDDALSDNERATKRRRIEKLADEFLNGQPLSISSVRPCPASLKSTIIRNKKSANEAKFTLQDANVTKDSHIWQDVDDDLEILQRSTRPPKLSVSEPLREGSGGDPPKEHQLLSTDRAQASCRLLRRSRVVQESNGPSDDAFKQAAALRARRARRASSEVLAVLHHGRSLSESTRSDNEVRGEANIGAIDEAGSHCATDQRLLRRKSYRIEVDVDEAVESGDELRLSRVETPLTLSRTMKPSEVSQISPQPVPRLVQSVAAFGMSSRRTPRRGNATRDEEESVVSRSSEQRRSRGTRTDRPASATYNADLLQDDSQTRLLRSQGFGPASRNHWTPVNPSIPAARQDPSPHTVNDSHFGNQPVAESEAPLESAYTEAQAAKDGSTPFVWRKRASKQPTYKAPESNDVATEDEKGLQRARALLFDAAKSGLQCGELQETRSYPPMLDVTFDHDSSFAPKLNMALVDEHLNAVLPPNTNPGQRSSAVKKALRRELRQSGAEITRCDSEPPTSSQVEVEPLQPEQSSPQPSALDDTFGQQMVTSEFWPGTQVLLNEAQKVLVTSPEKSGAEGRVYDHATPSGNEKTGDERSVSAGREPLKQLAQEPLPSTQALLGSFEGFSTVKKPRTISQTSPLPTPTATGKAHGGPSKLTTTRTSTGDTKSKHSSSLRFSTSMIESPPQSARMDDASLAKARSAQSTNEASSVDMMTSVPASKTSGVGSSVSRKGVVPNEATQLSESGQHPSADSIPSQSFTSVAPLSSFQAAQSRSSLHRGDSQLDRTIDEFATGFLSTRDLDDVLSQVR